MSLVEQFEYLMARRTYNKSFQINRGKSTQPSQSLLGFGKLTQSIYEQAFVQKINISPSRNNTEKYHELRRKLASRGGEKSRKISMKSTTNKDNVKDNFDSEQLVANGNTIDFIPNSLLCSKAIVHSDIRNQEVVWRKTLKQSGQELKSKHSQERSNMNFIKSKRRFSQDIQPNTHNATIFVGKHTRLKYPKKMSQITSSGESPVDSKSPNQSYRIKNSPRKIGSNRSQLTKDTKGSENEFVLERIDPWNSCFEDDDIMF